LIRSGAGEEVLVGSPIASIFTSFCTSTVAFRYCDVSVAGRSARPHDADLQPGLVTGAGSRIWPIAAAVAIQHVASISFCAWFESRLPAVFAW
jgi:hypothetical protein